jgi:hypothetical protein
VIFLHYSLEILFFINEIGTSACHLTDGDGVKRRFYTTHEDTSSLYCYLLSCDAVYIVPTAPGWRDPGNIVDIMLSMMDDEGKLRVPVSSGKNRMRDGR